MTERVCHYAIRGIAHYFGHVTCGPEVLASCDHQHQTRRAAEQCAEKMARVAIARRTREGEATEGER